MAAEKHLVSGAVTKGIWCDLHALPHCYEATVYSVWENGGELNMSEVKTIRQCDTR